MILTKGFWDDKIFAVKRENQIKGEIKMNKRLLFKKLFTTVIAMVLVCLTLTSVACGGSGDKDPDNSGDSGKIVVSPTVVNVRVYKGGYGTSWIYDIAEKFGETYKDQGYSINIMKPSSDISGTVVINELSTGGNGIDLYISGPVKPTLVSEYVEDLTEEVYNKAPIKFDGTEETVLYKDKIVAGMTEYFTVDGKIVGTPYMTATNGLVVNKTKLAKYDLSLPNTTDELVSCFDTILTGNGTSMGNSFKSNIYPHTFLASANGYPTTFQYTLLAQYLGYDKYLEFLNLSKDGEDMITDGYTVYQNTDLIDVYEDLYRIFDQIYATDGIKSQDTGTAQAKVMNPTSGAVFYMCGDWFLNEEKKDYKNYLNDITFIKYPVTSALGTKLFGSGTTLNLSDSDADKLLSYIITLADANKTAAEVVSSVKSEKGYTITEAQATRVLEARGLYYNRGYEHNAYVTKNSKSKDVAYLFLRYLASDDAAQLILDEANATTPFKSNYTSNSQYEFVNNAATFVQSSYAKSIFRYGSLQSLSLKIPEVVCRMSPKNTEYIAQYVSNLMISKYDYNTLTVTKSESVYRDAATTHFNEEKDYVTSNWSKWIEYYGLNK